MDSAAVEVQVPVKLPLQHQFLKPMKTMSDQAFEISTISTHKASKKLNDIRAMEDVLNGNIAPASYGNALEEVFIMFNILDPGSPPANDEFIYHPEDKLLEMVLKLRHEMVMSASPAEARKLLEASLRHALLRGLPRMDIPDFRAREFAEDVLNVLGISI